MRLTEIPPNERLTILGEGYVTLKHPSSVGISMSFIQEGSKSHILKIKRIKDNHFYALKVFKPEYQDPVIKSVCDHLKFFKNMPGMKVVERDCLTRENAADFITMYPEGTYSVLMPWIQGRTWFEYILSKTGITKQESLNTASNLANVLALLEEVPSSHCDISGSNIVIPKIEDGLIELVDVETLWSEDMPQPAQFPAGTRGYIHQNNPTLRQWGPFADRFAAAIILAEILCWHDIDIRKTSGQESFFEDDELQHSSSSKYELVQATLEKTFPAAAELFRIAWHARELSQCPSLRDWAIALEARDFSVSKLSSRFLDASSSENYPLANQIYQRLERHQIPLSEELFKSYIWLKKVEKTHLNVSRALATNDDYQLILAWRQLLPGIELTKKEKKRVRVAEARVKRTPALYRAIEANDDKTVVDLVSDALFDDYPFIEAHYFDAIRRIKKKEAVLIHLRNSNAKLDQNTKIDLLESAGLLTSNLLSPEDINQFLETPLTFLSDKKSDRTSEADDQMLNIEENDAFSILDRWHSGKLSIEDLDDEIEEKELIEKIRNYGYEIQLQRALNRKDEKRLKSLLDRNGNKVYAKLPADLRAKIDDFLRNKDANS